MAESFTVALTLTLGGYESAIAPNTYYSKIMTFPDILYKSENCLLVLRSVFLFLLFSSKNKITLAKILEKRGPLF